MTIDGEAVADGNNLVKFDVDTASGTETLQLQKSDLSEGAVQFGENAREMIITFNFTNEGSKTYSATLTPNLTTTDNMVVKYSADKATWADQPSVVTVNAPAEQGGSTSAVYYVRIAIDNVAYDADFEGTFSWALAA